MEEQPLPLIVVEPADGTLYQCGDLTRRPVRVTTGRPAAGSDRVPIAGGGVGLGILILGYNHARGVVLPPEHVDGSSLIIFMVYASIHKKPVPCASGERMNEGGMYAFMKE